jgi:flagellar motor switch protein FliG
MSGARRSAILLLSLDADSAAEVFKFLPSTDVEAISIEMARLSQVSHEEMRQVLEEFMDETDQYAAINIQTSDHIRAVLTKALGSERAASLIDDILESTNTGSGIDKLNLMEASMVAEMIRDEHPQIIATILVHLERHQASDILQLLPDRLRNDIILRIATFSGVQPVALQELTEVLGVMLDGQSLKRSKMGGVRTAAEILNLMSSTHDVSAIEPVRQHNEALARFVRR